MADKRRLPLPRPARPTSNHSHREISWWKEYFSTKREIHAVRVKTYINNVGCVQAAAERHEASYWAELRQCDKGYFKEYFIKLFSQCWPGKRFETLGFCFTVQDREHYFEFASESDSLSTNMSIVEAVEGCWVGLWRQVGDLDLQIKNCEIQQTT